MTQNYSASNLEGIRANPGRPKIVMDSRAQIISQARRNTLSSMLVMANNMAHLLYAGFEDFDVSSDAMAKNND